MRKQRGDQLLLLNLARLRLKHEAHSGILAALIARRVQQREHAGFELSLLLAQSFFAGFDFRIGDLFNLFEHLGRAHALRQFCDHQLPLPTRQLFNLPARPHLEAASPSAVRLCNIAGRADDLAAIGKIRAGNHRKQLLIGELRSLDQRHCGLRNFMQIVAGDFSGQAHSDATGAIEQVKRQARG